MATPLNLQPRQPLGLPAGSVRAVLTFVILGLVWTIMLLPKDRNVEFPLYLLYLMFLALGCFFTAHGRTIGAPGGRSPLYFPAGSLRFLVIAGFVAVLGYRYYLNPDWHEVFFLNQPHLELPYIPLVLLGGFFAGIILSKMARLVFRGPQGMPYWYQDIQAWLALLATAVWCGMAVYLLFIEPGLEKKPDLHVWEIFLTGVTGFYFGARS